MDKLVHPDNASKTRLVLVGPMVPYRGGIAHFLETMYGGLQQRGHDVHAVTFTRQYPEWLFPGKTQYESRTSEHPAPAVRLIDTLNPLSWRRTARYIAAMEPDAVIFHYWMPFFAPAFGAIARHVGKKGARILVVVHNVIPHERQLGSVALGRYFLRAVHGTIVMSSSVARDLDMLGITAPMRQIAHPVYNVFGEAMPKDKARWQLALWPEAPVLLFFGFVRKYKGLHVLLESMPRVVEALPNVRLIVAGEFYDDKAAHRAVVKRYGLEGHVQFHDEYIPQNKVRHYFSAADVVVQPYVSATQSGVAQIAFHFDTPAIITDVGGLAEVVPHERAGLVVPPNDAEALADAIIRFFKEQLSDRLIEGVRHEKKKYSWEHLYEAVESLLGDGETERG